jgi:UDP-GlcNAc:undecaprenyl-phosphate GlcNAc-1-phosphate transferase
MNKSFEPISYLTAFAATFALLWVLRSLAPRIGLVDQPAGHRHHEHATPLVGGLAMFCGFLFAVLALPTPLSSFRPFFVGAALLVIVGVLDDMHELSSRARFAAQIVASLLMIYWGGVVLTDLGYLMTENLFTLGRYSVPLTVFATVGVINALNMSDGMDGLAGSLALVGFTFIALTAAAAGQGDVVGVVVLLMIVVAAFLLFNLRLPWRPRALLFMGDAGSMFLGFALTWLFVALSQGEGRSLLPVTALWFLAVPLFDTVAMLMRRILLRRSPFQADREHVHHLLFALGMSVNRTLLVVVLCAVLLAAIGLWAQLAAVPERYMFYAFLALFGLYFVGSWIAWTRLGGQAGVEARRPPPAFVERRRGPADRRRDERRKGVDRRSGHADRRKHGSGAQDQL